MKTISGSDLGAQLRHHLQDLRLNGDVERRRRLVGEQQPGPAGQRHCDHHALAHAAGQLMRIGGKPALRIGNPHLVEQFERAGARRGGRHAFMALDAFGNLLADGHDRIERRHRLLEDHREVASPHVAQRGLVQRGKVGAAETYPPAVDARATRQQPHDRQRRQALAAAGFADEA